MNESAMQNHCSAPVNTGLYFQPMFYSPYKTMDSLYRDFPQKMSAALSENPASVIHSLNLAHNSLDNQGIQYNDS